MAILAFILISVVTLSIHSEANQEIKRNVRRVELEWSIDSLPRKEEVDCKPHKSVYWEKDGIRKGNGESLVLFLKEPRDAGTYNCRSNETHELLHSETIYVMKILPNGKIAEPLLEESNGTFFRCTTNNYSGNFTCFWKSTIKDLKFEPGFEGSSKSTISCGDHEGTEGIYSVSCKKEQNCSSTEEYEPIKISLHVYRGNVYETHHQNFFLKDIRKPDTTECWVHQGGLLTWRPPKTWSTPYSYFGLTYEIKIARQHGKEKLCNVTKNTLYQNEDLLACYKHECQRHAKCFMRSRDLYNKRSPWSDWSTCRNDSLNDISHIHEDKSKIKECKCQN